MNPSLEARLAKNEIELARLFIPVAKAALAANDLYQAEQARIRAQAAHFRGSRLLAKLNGPDGASLSAELGYLQSAIDALSHQFEPWSR